MTKQEMHIVKLEISGNREQPVCCIDSYKTKTWWVNDKRHRIDGPAVEYANGDKVWYVDGKLHRTDGPAVEYTDGDKAWYVDGKVHRLDGPAIERADGTKSWWINDRLLTEQEFNEKVKEFMSVCEMDNHGNKFWKLNGKLHRLNGPAIEYPNGSKEWFVNGKHHRLDGPAIEDINGDKWWLINGKHLTEQEFNEITKMKE